MEKGQGQRVILDVVEYLGSGYGITTDRTEKLLEENITLCGTIRKNKTFILSEFSSATDKKEYSGMFAFREHRNLVSYVPKQNTGFIVLSSER